MILSFPMTSPFFCVCVCGGGGKLLNETCHEKRKLSSEDFDQVRLKSACSPTETSWSLESLDLASTAVILSR